MGVEFEIDNLEDMCAAMCDNKVPVKTRKAIWGQDYDYRQDKIYMCPVCPDCKEAIHKCEDRKYHCFDCGEVVEVDDPEMIKWLREREEVRTEFRDCPRFVLDDGTVIGCGGKRTVETHLMRNPVTLEWQVMGVQCTKCGSRFIV